jgi:isopentenyl phosphate kinase
MLTILKIGGSVITDKKSEMPKVNYDVLDRLSREIAEGRKGDLIFIHGAGSYGHQIVKRTGINEGIRNKEQILAFAETQRLQNELNVLVTKSLIEKGVPAIPCQASSHTIMDAGRLVKMDTETIKGFLDVGLVPVLYGVPAYDRKQKCSILSGDQILPYLALKLGASRTIHGTNVDGVFTSDPNKDKNAKLITEITSDKFDEVRKALGGSGDVDVTGGMLGKVTELLDLAKKGIESQLINANRPGYVKKALLGEKVLGTVIRR